MANEKAMEAAVATWLQTGHAIVARQVRVGGKILDIVAYDAKRGIFRVFELKADHSEVVVTQACRQISLYRMKILKNPNDFVKSASKKILMHFGKWVRATHRGRTIAVEFYVVLTDEACKREKTALQLLDPKRGDTRIGILRFKSDGTCSKTVRVGRTKHKLGSATAEEFLLKGWAAQVTKTGN